MGIPGTTADQRDMAMLGKRQVLRVRNDKASLSAQRALTIASAELQVCHHFGLREHRDGKLGSVVGAVQADTDDWWLP